MRVLALLSAMLPFSVWVGSAQEKDAPPRPPPHLWLASASEQDGEVVIQIAKPQERGGPGGPGGFEPGVKSLPAATVMQWSNVRKVTLGKTVQAFRVNGERAESRFVLRALARPKGVAVFVRTKESDLTNPAPFYLALLREDTLALVVNEKDIYSEQP